MPATTTERTEHVTFDLVEPRRVVQTEPGGHKSEFDPFRWGAFTRGTLVVRACRIPKPFQVGADLCRDGYLVYDGQLKAISAQTFARDYEPLNPRAL